MKGSLRICCTDTTQLAVGLVARQKRIGSKYKAGPKACKSWIKVKNKAAPGYTRFRRWSDDGDKPSRWRFARSTPPVEPPEPLFIGFNRKRYLSKHLIDLIRMLAAPLTSSGRRRASAQYNLQLY